MRYLSSLQRSVTLYGAFSCMIGLVLFSVLTAWGQRDCVLKKDIDSIKVYACTSEHLKFKSIKATFTVNARLSQLVAFVMDIENYRNWQYNTIHARVMKQISEKEVLYYTEIAAPWPVNNRDMVVDLWLSQDIRTKVVMITAKSLPQEAPEKDRIVRVPTSLATWTVVPLSNSLLKVEYFIGIDPGGSVPAWMINMVSAEAPLKSFKTLKEKIHQKKYLNAKVPFILDF